MIYRLGTRKSLLALAQSGWVARRFESLHPGDTVELVGIETQGDRVLDKPLSQIEGKEFFVAELDQALLSGKVDFTVHSMKDLATERPAAIQCAAIPERKNPRDIVFFSPSVVQKLTEGRTLRIGTSSPRRLENIPPFLQKALPVLNTNKTPPNLEWLPIRGNVNTRLSRLHEPQNSPTQLDAVVLALAGIERLWDNPSAKEVLQELLHGVRWMVLPLTENPTAPAQGALAIECLNSNTSLFNKLKSLHHPATEQAVHQERLLLSELGGGCHQRFGATVQTVPYLGPVLRAFGKTTAGANVDRWVWKTPSPPAHPPSPEQVWDGGQFPLSSVSLSTLPTLKPGTQCVFIAHSKAIPDANSELFQEISTCNLWTSGTASWFKAAKLGLWISGCTEGFGFEQITHWAETCPVLKLPTQEGWTMLSHREASSSALATYEHNKTPVPQEEAAQVYRARYFYWTSPQQWTRYSRYLAAGVALHHACGPGKTADFLKQALVFPNREEWKKWLSH